MAAFLVDDLSRILLGLLFVVAFGWMAALMFPGDDAYANETWQQAFVSEDVVPPLE